MRSAGATLWAHRHEVCEASRERSEMASEKMTSGEDAAEAQWELF